MIKLKDLIKEVKKDKTVYKNRWISIKKFVSRKDKQEYFYLHEERCHSGIVAVLLYRRTGKDSWEYGVRKEVIPAWGSEPQLCALTGGIDDGDSPEDTAVKEVKEESGYEIDKKDLKSLGTCWSNKTADSKYFLFAVDIEDREPGKKTGDGTELDNEGTVEWMYYDKDKIQCPILATMILRLGL